MLGRPGTVRGTTSVNYSVYQYYGRYTALTPGEASYVVESSAHWLSGE